MDFMPVLLQVVPEMEGTRGVPEAFPADNEKEFHEYPAGMVSFLSSSLRAGLPSGSWQGLLHGIFGRFRDEDTCSEINDDADTTGEKGNHHPDKPDDSRIDFHIPA